MTVRKHIALIGTGPVSILKAYLLVKRDPTLKVSLFESSSNLGGAWYSDISPKGHEIESGCHIWSYVPEVYSFLKSEFALELTPMNPSPTFVGKKLKVNYSTKNTLDTYKHIFKSLLKFKKPAIKNHPGFYGRIFGKKNQYPKLGSVELINALKLKIEKEKNIEIIQNFMVDEIKISDQVELIGKDNTYVCDQLFMTSVSEVQKISMKDQIIEMEQSQIDYIHFLIALSNPTNKKMSYWRLMNDPVVHRISDISYQTANEENLLLVGIKGDAYHSTSEEDLLKHCEKVFRSLKLIVPETSVEKLKTYIFPTYYINGQIRERINEISPSQIQLIHSTDLMHGFYYILKEENLI